jgi:rhodanese-related sulfurtransferase
LAAQYIEKGYPNAKALKDGIDGWEAAGYPMKTATH